MQALDTCCCSSNSQCSSSSVTLPHEEDESFSISPSLVVNSLRTCRLDLLLLSSHLQRAGYSDVSCVQMLCFLHHVLQFLRICPWRRGMSCQTSDAGRESCSMILRFVIAHMSTTESVELHLISSAL